MTNIEVNGDNAGSAFFSRVPVVTVHKENIDQVKETLVSDIQNCSFLAVDCELSGLGERKRLNVAAVDERYRNTCLVAKTRSIISLGVSTFTWLPRTDEAQPSWSYRVASYNLLVLCSEDYIVEPASLQFLVQHGFDFSAQYGLGLGYNRGNDSEDEAERGKQVLRTIFSEIVRSKRPLVVHNGLIDLVFLYHNLWAALPPKLDTFICDVSELFPGGVYDTKYIADYVARTQASYLEFVFKKELRNNREKSDKGRPHVRIQFKEYSEEDEDIDWRGVSVREGEQSDVEICQSFADHGHCPTSDSCDLSHDIDLIVTQKTAQQDKKWRKRKMQEDGGNSNGEAKQAKCDEDVKETNGNGVSKSSASLRVKAGGHRAGYDAFMTGFSLATFLVHHTALPQAPESWTPEGIKTEKIVNRIYLVCKDFPLLIQRSSFARCSVQHDAKMRRLGLYEAEKVVDNDLDNKHSV